VEIQPVTGKSSLEQQDYTATSPLRLADFWPCQRFLSKIAAIVDSICVNSAGSKAMAVSADRHQQKQTRASANPVSAKVSLAGRSEKRHHKRTIEAPEQ
jgi:hypothetical protein